MASSVDSEAIETRNWLELPREVTSSIMKKLGTVETLTTAQWVCTQWWSICNDPLMWRTIDMPFSQSIRPRPSDVFLSNICRQAIDLSCGQFVDINIEHFCTDALLLHIVHSASHLRRLRLVDCISVSNEVLIEVAKKLPYLEELDISICRKISKDALEAIGQCCPLLKSLRFNVLAVHDPFGKYKSDEVALVIAKTMPGLQHLQLIGNNMTDIGLLAILDGCPQLKSLDLRQCFKLTFGGSLLSRCVEQVKDLRYPGDSTDDCSYDAEIDYEDYMDEFNLVAELWSLI